MRPIIGVIGNQHLINDQYNVQASGTMNCDALVNVAGCMPLIIPSNPQHVSVEELQACFDGFVFTGARANVHPEEYGEAETEAHGSFDRGRDTISLALIRACVASGQPFWEFAAVFRKSLLQWEARFIQRSAICRGGTIIACHPMARWKKNLHCVTKLR